MLVIWGDILSFRLGRLSNIQRYFKLEYGQFSIDRFEPVLNLMEIIQKPHFIDELPSNKWPKILNTRLVTVTKA